MREAQCVYVTVSENEGEIYFDGQTPAELKTYIKKMKWLKWERRLSDKGTGRDKWFLVADFQTRQMSINMESIEISGWQMLFWRMGWYCIIEKAEMMNLM